MRSSIPKILFLQFFIFCVAPLFAQEKSDFLIASSLRGFEILNRYQQKISDKEKSSFQSYLPSKIINQDMFLSDGFTSAMEISVEQQTYFLLLNEEKQPVIVDPVGDYKIIENADLADDVLKVEKAGRVKFAKGTFSITKSNSVFLNKNVIIREIFKKQNNVYVFNVSDGEYGWINYSDKSAITKIASDKISKEITIPELIVEKVAEEVEKINILYRKLFSDLNQMYPEKNEPPEIYLINSAREITLNLPPNFEKHFPKTVLYLVNELEIIITGTPFSVVRNNDKLQIKMKEQI